MRRAADELKKPSAKPKKKIDKRKKPVTLTKKQLEARRKNIVKAQKARISKRTKRSRRVSKKDLEAKTIDLPPLIVKPSVNGYHMALSLNDFAAIEEVLQNCALAGLSLTRCPAMLESTEAIKNVGAAIGEVCLEGITTLKNAKLYKRPGKKGANYAKKTKTDEEIS